MAKYDELSKIRIVDGVATGEQRLATNFVSHRTDDVHAGGIARALGFSGGLVSGLIHDEQFVPLALHFFGSSWFECGRYSFYYRTATYDQDPVQAYMEVPPVGEGPKQVRAWSKTPGGDIVCDGTIGLGAVATPSGLEMALSRFVAAKDLRIVGGLEPGQQLPTEIRRFPLHERDARLSSQRTDQPAGEAQMQRLGSTTEPLSWYFGPSPWGRPIAGSLALMRLLRAPIGLLDLGGAFEVIGGIDVRFHKGPIFVDQDYELRSWIAGVGASPKTEMAWFYSKLYHPGKEEVLAETTVLVRYFARNIREPTPVVTVSSVMSP